MAADRFNELVADALPDASIPSKRRAPRLSTEVPAAASFRIAGDTIWALFAVQGDRVSSVDIAAADAATQAGYRAAFVATTDDQMNAVGEVFAEHNLHVICEIAGEGQFVHPPDEEEQIDDEAPPASDTRVPMSMLEEALGDGLPAHLTDALNWLINDYVEAGVASDDAEADALLEFARQEIFALGLDPQHLAGTAFIRTLEASGMGPRRDHFFHSFQNYFLGLPIIRQLRPHFDQFKDHCKLHWDVDPFEVWFLTAMWHDVGYGNQKLGDVLSATLGEIPDDQTLAFIRRTYLDHPDAQDAVRILASLIGRLLNERVPSTEWTEPHNQTRINERAAGVREALVDNVSESHGAFGAIRLYRDYIGSIDAMEEDARALARQTVLLAAASMPFHDWKFRRSVRLHCATCVLSTANLALASLLAFIDSIQDDRRDLAGGTEPRVLLRGFTISEDRVVLAHVDRAALLPADVFPKIVEGRDVAATIRNARDSLELRYPAWMQG